MAMNFYARKSQSRKIPRGNYGGQNIGERGKWTVKPWQNFEYNNRVEKKKKKTKNNFLIARNICLKYYFIRSKKSFWAVLSSSLVSTQLTLLNLRKWMHYFSDLLLKNEKKVFEYIRNEENIQIKKFYALSIRKYGSSFPQLV